MRTHRPARAIPLAAEPAPQVRGAYAGVIALAALALSACDHSGPPRDDPEAFAWRGHLAAPGVVQIRNIVGPITVEPSPDSLIHVSAATRWTKGDPKRDVQFQAVTSGSTVTICAVWGRGTCTATDYSSRSKKRVSIGWSSRSDARVAFTVRVPAGLRVDASTITGGVNVRTAGPVRARTIDGDINVGTAVGPVNAESVNGSVDIRMTTIGDTGAVRAVTKNGSAVAYVPEITDGSIEASTLNGRIGSDFGGLAPSNSRAQRRFGTTIGAGARTYRVETLNGSAWLRLINADGTVGPAEPTTAASAQPRPGQPVVAPLTQASKRP